MAHRTRPAIRNLQGDHGSAGSSSIEAQRAALGLDRYETAGNASAFVIIADPADQVVGTNVETIAGGSSIQPSILLGLEESAEAVEEELAVAAVMEDLESAGAEDDAVAVSESDVAEGADDTATLELPLAEADEYDASNEPLLPVQEEVIRSVQAELQERGFGIDKADGQYGPKSITAVRLFKIARGLPVTDDITVALLGELDIEP